MSLAQHSEAVLVKSVWRVNEIQKNFIYISSDNRTSSLNLSTSYLFAMDKRNSLTAKKKLKRMENLKSKIWTFQIWWNQN